MPPNTVGAVLADVQATSPRSVADPIHIIVRYPMTGQGGDWNEDQGAMRISVHSRDPYYVAAHEAFHAVSQSPASEVEEGLVYGMTAIWTGRSRDWRYEQTSVASASHTYSPDGAHTTNILYRIYQKVGRETAFQFVLDVDKEHMPSSVAELVSAMQEVAEDLDILTAVNEVLIAVGEIESDSDDELDELRKLQAQAEAEGLSHTTMARLINSMTTQAFIQWLRDWLRDREDNEKEK